MPSFITRKYRRISVEIHRIMIGDPKSRKSKTLDQLREGTDYYEECIVRYVIGVSLNGLHAFLCFVLLTHSIRACPSKESSLRRRRKRL